MAGYATVATAPGPTPPTGLDPSQWQDWYLNNVPEAGWVKYLQGLGLYGITPQARYAQNQYNRAYGGYEAAASDNPNLGFYDWIQHSGFDFGSEYNNLSPDQRGDFSSRTLTPRTRFMRAY